MGRRQARRFQPGLDSLELRQVLSASNPVVHEAIVPIAVPIGTYNNTFTQIDDAFDSYEGSTVDNVLNAIGSLAAGAVSTISAINTATDPNASSVSIGDGTIAEDSSGNASDLQGRLITAVSQLPGGQAEAVSLVNRTFTYGGLSTDDAPYFQSKLTALVKQYVTQQVHRGNMILVWPGETLPRHRA
jgi:hypothetical protein